MKFTLLVVACILTTNSFSQKSVFFKFVVDHPTVDTLTGAYYGMQFEFTSQRTYFSNNEFADKGLLVKDTTQNSAIYFKHSSNKWFIKNFGNKWQLFYSDSKQKPTPSLRINSKNFRVNWKKNKTMSGKEVAVFMLKPQGFISNHQPDFLFDCHKGIIGLKTEDVTLIREDFK